MTPDQVGQVGWLELNAWAKAHRKIRARQMIRVMVAAQGNEKGWKLQMQHLAKIVNE